MPSQQTIIRFGTLLWSVVEVGDSMEKSWEEIVQETDGVRLRSAP